MFTLISGYAAWIVGVGAAATLLITLYRKARKKIRLAWSKFTSTSEALLGRDEIRHPDTGEVLVEATPNIGARMARIEGAVVTLAETTATMVSLSARVDDVSLRVDEVALSLRDHITESTKNNELRMQEQTEMWKAVRAVANSTPRE